MHTKTVRKFSEWRGLPKRKKKMNKDSVAFIIKMVQDEMFNDHDALVKADSPRDQLDALVDAYYYIEDTCAKHSFDTEKWINGNKERKGWLHKIDDRQSMLDESQAKNVANKVDTGLERLSSAKTYGEQESCLSRIIIILRNTASNMGADIDKLFLIVHGANMRKINPETGEPWSIREDGKVMKPYKKDGFDFDWYGPEEELDAELTKQGF